MVAAFDQAGGSPREVSLLHSLFEQKANPSDGEPENTSSGGRPGKSRPFFLDNSAATR